MRRYTQKEMSEILRIAAETQRAETAPTGDFTLEEIQRVAGEVGLDPARVEMAALQLESRSRHGSRSNPWHDTVVIRLAAPPTDEDWENTVAKLREVIGCVGTIRETADGAIEWSGSREGNTFVAVMHRGSANPRLTLAANRTGTEAIMWGVGGTVAIMTALIGTAAFAKGGFTGLEPVSLATLITLAGGTLFGGLKAASAVGRARTARLRDQLSSLLHRPNPAPTSQTTLQPEEASLTIETES